jgi:hypothetical protein
LGAEVRRTVTVTIALACEGGVVGAAALRRATLDHRLRDYARAGRRPCVWKVSGGGSLPLYAHQRPYSSTSCQGSFTAIPSSDGCAFERARLRLRANPLHRGNRYAESLGNLAHPRASGGRQGFPDAVLDIGGQSGPA